MTPEPNTTAPGRRRRNLLLTIAFATSAALVAVTGWRAALARAEKAIVCPRASVLLVVIDALRPDHLGMYGYDSPTSPFLDGLAVRSVVFDRAISQGGWTKPSIGSLFTSLYPHEHGAVAHQDALRSAPATLAGTLDSAGYFTVAVHGSAFLDSAFGFDRGFDSYQNLSNAPAADLVEEFLATPGLDTNRPFFAYLHFMEPHLPYKPPAAFRERFFTGYSGQLATNRLGTRQDILERKGPELNAEDKAHITSLYDAEICYADAMLEQLFAEMKLRGLLENTIVIVTADHGEEFWDHGGFEHGHTMYNELLRVPLLMLHPKGLGAGSRVKQTVRLVDVYPTLMRWLGLKQPDETRGADLTPAVAHGRNLGLAAFSESTLYGHEQKAIQTGTYKLILDAKTGRKELYNLAADPHETSPVTQPAVENMLAKQLEQAASSGAVPAGPPTRVNIDPELNKQLRSLGYVR